MKITKISTADGSSSLYREDIDETYHSRHGAVQEAMHVFIKAGLEFVVNSNYETHKEINILEVGFGTGLNCLLTALEVEKLGVKVNYYTVETIPLSKELTSELSYRELNPQLFDEIHTCDWEIKKEISKGFSLTKLETKIQDLELESASIDLIYYDAFGPRAQPEMWMLEIFEKLSHLSSEKGVFVTYCAKGQVRRDLESVGFSMDRLPGPPGKREMLRGIKK